MGLEDRGRGRSDRHIQKRRRQCDHGGRKWSDGSHKSGNAWSHQELEETRNAISPRVPRGSLADNLISPCGLHNCERYISVALSQPVCGALSQQPRDTDAPVLWLLPPPRPSRPAVFAGCLAGLFALHLSGLLLLNPAGSRGRQRSDFLQAALPAEVASHAHPCAPA